MRGEEENHGRRSRLGAVVGDGVRLFAVDRFDNAGLGSAFGNIDDERFAQAAHAHPCGPSGLVVCTQTHDPYVHVGAVDWHKGAGLVDRHDGLVGYVPALSAARRTGCSLAGIARSLNCV